MERSSLPPSTPRTHSRLVPGRISLETPCRQFQDMAVDNQSQRYIEQFHLSGSFCEQGGWVNRGDGGNREMTSVNSVDSCSVHSHQILNIPSGVSSIDDQMEKLFFMSC